MDIQKGAVEEIEDSIGAMVYQPKARMMLVTPQRSGLIHRPARQTENHRKVLIRKQAGRNNHTA